jgi:predicted acyltransferase
MASSGLGFVAVARKTDSAVWDFLAYQFDHVPWIGCSFWDLIQPSFMFMVGVAMPYSFAKRRERGDSELSLFLHVLGRSLILILLGVFLSSNGARETNFTFVNVLTQIGLGYTFLYLLLGRGVAVQLTAVAAILAGYWYVFFNHPLPGSEFDPAAVGLPKDWEQMTGLFAHWNKNANFAADFDVWFLNLFPRAQPFRFNSGGYQTLNFVPSLATMILGLMAGELLRGPRDAWQKARVLIGAGALCLVLGPVAGGTICPVVKRIWTPSWTLFSAGWTFWMLAAFYWIIDLRGHRAWAFPLVVVGMNSIAMYCMAQLIRPWTARTLKTHFGQGIFDGTYGPISESVAVLFVLWLACWWMYRSRIFIRI